MPYNRNNPFNGDFYNCVKFFNGNPNGDVILAGGTGTCGVEVIDLKEMRIIHKFKMHKTVYTIDSNEKNVTFGGMENALEIAEIQSPFFV